MHSLAERRKHLWHGQTVFRLLRRELVLSEWRDPVQGAQDLEPSLQSPHRKMYEPVLVSQWVRAALFGSGVVAGPRVSFSLELQLRAILQLSIGVRGAQGQRSELLKQRGVLDELLLQLEPPVRRQGSDMHGHHRPAVLWLKLLQQWQL